jgi:hypothetical protein
VAAFQAQSAFSGAGFTTQESETIVTHPLRRRIVRLLILLGSVGISSSFLGAPRGDTVLREGDLLICYAREQVSKNLASRIKGTEGNKEHAEKVAEERRLDEHRRHTDDYG